MLLLELQPISPMVPFAWCSFLHCSCRGAQLRAHSNSEVTPPWLSASTNKPSAQVLSSYGLFLHLSLELQSCAKYPPPLVSWPFCAKEKSAGSILCFSLPRHLHRLFYCSPVLQPTTSTRVQSDILLPNFLQERLIKNQIKFLHRVKSWHIAYIQ